MDEQSEGLFGVLDYVWCYIIMEGIGGKGGEAEKQQNPGGVHERKGWHAGRFGDEIEQLHDG